MQQAHGKKCSVIGNKTRSKAAGENPTAYYHMSPLLRLLRLAPEALTLFPEQGTLSTTPTHFYLPPTNPQSNTMVF